MNRKEEQKKNVTLSGFFGATIGTLGTYVYKEENKGKMLAIHLLSLAEAGIQVLVPIYIAKWLVDTRISSSSEKEDPTALYLGLSGLFLGLVLPRIRGLLVDAVKRDVQQKITLDMVSKVYDGELNELMGQPTGQPAAIVSKNYGSVQSVMPIMVSDILPCILETFGISAVLSAKFGMVGAVPTLVLLPYLMGAVGGEIYSILLKINNQSTMVEAFGKLLEVINNYTIAHQYGNLDLELDKLDKSLNKLGHSFKSVHRAEEYTAAALALITKMGMIGAVAYAYYYPPTPKFWSEDVLLFSYYVSRAGFLTEILPTKINAVFTGLIDTNMIVDFFKTDTAVPDPITPENLELSSAPFIEFRNVSFNYGEDKIGVSNISFTINAGQKFAIMGPTGSGKSTLFKLLQRFYDYKGEILVNGVDIKMLPKAQLRSYISVVSQDTNLTSDTLFDSIKYADRNASEDDVLSAAKFAKLDLNRDRFFETGQRDGSNFSGGEKQRTNIARALLKPSSYIFLLDEPTSALDQQTSQKIHDVLDQLTIDVTTLMVTHDPNAVIHVDTIVYMEKGQIVEIGTFNDLMQKQGSFYNQFLVQCEKLGVSAADIKPVSKVQKMESDEFSQWRSARQQNVFLWKEATPHLQIIDPQSETIKKIM